MTKKLKVKKKSRLVFSLIVIAIFILAGFGIFAAYLGSENMPVSAGNSEIISIEIPKGISTEKIASILDGKKLIRSVLVFKLKSKIEGYDATYKSGFYSLSQSMSMEEIMIQLRKGTTSALRFTIPEGFDIKKITERLANEKLINPTNFLRQIEQGSFDYKFLRDAPAGNERLEGYLYPDTYEVFPNSSEKKILDKMLSRFNQVFTEEYYARAKELGMSVGEVLTLASIIEREAKIPGDRPLISSVFHNRLSLKMPLQSCATVQFVLGDQKAKLTNKDIAIDSPYNTYIVAGLPPGPICSPGLASIKAALYPSDTKFLYFLAKGDGSSVFSVTYKDFLKNKAKYIN